MDRVHMFLDKLLLMLKKSTMKRMMTFMRFRIRTILRPAEARRGQVARTRRVQVLASGARAQLCGFSTSSSRRTTSTHKRGLHSWNDSLRLNKRWQDSSRRRGRSSWKGKKNQLQKIMQIAIDAGVSRNSVEFYTIGYLYEDEEMKQLFLNLQTGPERVQFLRRFCSDYQLQ